MEQLKKWIEDSLRGEYEYEAYIESTEKLLVETSRESLENLSKSKEVGLGIRVLRDFKQGFAYTTDLSWTAVSSCVKRAVESLELTPEDDGFVLNKGEFKGHLQADYDHEGLSLSVEDKAELLINLERLAKDFDRRVVGTRKTSLKEF
ncbi:MAG: PmbA/TldA family metallopeptidase, partial [Thermocrinis sp.]|uniref:PmbA/TldA family metallopeptidase n=1 Tax=Thermocrinis sp. TaxID=2024383 RepID=UPI003C0825FD